MMRKLEFLVCWLSVFNEKVGIFSLLALCLSSQGTSPLIIEKKGFKYKLYTSF